jgi:hypothetical protein
MTAMAMRYAGFHATTANNGRHRDINIDQGAVNAVKRVVRIAKSFLHCGPTRRFLTATRSRTQAWNS